MVKWENDLLEAELDTSVSATFVNVVPELVSLILERNFLTRKVTPALGKVHLEAAIQSVL